MHADLIERYGGPPGVRDYGLIEAAVFRPQSGYYGDLIEEAAALWESLSQNHPFVDGNKRVSFAAMDVFLRINGMHITADPVEAYDQISELYETGRLEFDALVEWLREHTQAAQT